MPATNVLYTECPKCSTKVDIREMRRRDKRACLYCKEPIMALIDLDRCDWSSGDYFPDRSEQE